MPSFRGFRADSPTPEVPSDGNAGIGEEIVIEHTRLGDFQEEGRAATCEAVHTVRCNGEDVARPHGAGPTVERHLHFAMQDAERFVLRSVTVSRTGLAVKYEEELPAVSRFRLVGDPTFDQAKRPKITQPKVLDNRFRSPAWPCSSPRGLS